MPFKTAILQMRSRNRDIQNNISIVIDRMKEAKSNHADILLLPECFITGYDLTIGNDDALTEDDLKQLCEKAKELHIGVVATAIARGTAKPQNAAFVIDKNGEILMQYAKVHTCDFADEKVLASGDEFKVCDFCGVKLGVIKCRKPEAN